VRWVRLRLCAADWELTNADSSGLEEATVPCTRSGSIAGRFGEQERSLLLGRLALA
jgi:hypothetical protein